MKVSNILPWISIAAAAAVTKSNNVIPCNAGAPSAELEEQYQMHLANGSKFQFDAAQPYVIYVYGHIVETFAKQGNTPFSQYFAQIDVLNRAFQPWGIQFQSRAIRRYVNDEWARSGPGTRAERQMRQAIQFNAGYANLNLYYLSNIGHDTSEPGLLGFCRFPAPYTAEVGLLDGCLQSVTTLPGSSDVNYNLGYTTVHEVGHWFGVRHVFSDEQPGNCNGPGDFVSDTPAQRSPTIGCPAYYPDTCPQLPGHDSIHNFMDYSNNQCMTHFTVGQMQRGSVMYNQYRAGRSTPI